VVVALVVLAGLELFWRSRGIETSVVDDEDLWSESRLALHGKGTRTIAVLGDSRALLGISTDTLREEVPGCTVFQLSIPASLPYAVLKDLADDEDFRGIVVCVIHAEGSEESCRGEQLGHVQHYRRNFNLNARLNRRIATVVQDHFVVVSPYVNLGRVVEEFIKTGELPRPQYLITRRDRSRIADYGKSDLEKLRATMRQGAEELLGRKTPDPETWVKEAMELDAPARKIQARGGRVVFVRLPTTEELWRDTRSAIPSVSTGTGWPGRRRRR